MVEAVIEFFARIAEGFMSPAGLIITALAALALLLVAANAVVAALRTEPSVKAAAPKRAPARATRPTEALPHAA